MPVGWSPLTTPTEPGTYRLYVQVTDGQGNAGYANAPFLVEAQPKNPSNDL